MRKNDEFFAKIAYTLHFVAFFAFAERLPTSATLMEEQRFQFSDITRIEFREVKSCCNGGIVAKSKTSVVARGSSWFESAEVAPTPWSHPVWHCWCRRKSIVHNGIIVSDGSKSSVFLL